MFHVALFNPVMPANTGNIIRLCANNGCQLHLIEPLGFDFEEKKLRRAGLDYHDLSKLVRYPDFSTFKEAMGKRAIYAITTKGTARYTEISFQADDVLLFGSETGGLDPEVMEQIAPRHRLRIPMQPNNRSLNLSNAVAIVTYHAWDQQGFAGGA
ncbi:tRNA (cytidine(34)-2'-O)-methyltransferase [Pseudidiomarina sp.]|uniref:tRNA (cytidine(34)-2'-O)-methyltransferase n=1 Tax=Pseudidiomarina sp. TaxID=2081707 RepID=UPI00299D3508|nr:tRNA (cytidine(34)-2'-O)-methyltransferase [Pseudidiomarina sp.]MDX1706001.1 tRNA (cytidine(34)-2'-O)-methyltransferase [Pseudidiomarina sp.]